MGNGKVGLFGTQRICSFARGALQNVFIILSSLLLVLQIRCGGTKIQYLLLFYRAFYTDVKYTNQRTQATLSSLVTCIDIACREVCIIDFRISVLNLHKACLHHVYTDVQKTSFSNFVYRQYRCDVPFQLTVYHTFGLYSQPVMQTLFKLTFCLCFRLTVVILTILVAIMWVFKINDNLVFSRKCI